MPRVLVVHIDHPELGRITGFLLSTVYNAKDDNLWAIFPSHGRLEFHRTAIKVVEFGVVNA